MHAITIKIHTAQHQQASGKDAQGGHLNDRNKACGAEHSHATNCNHNLDHCFINGPKSHSSYHLGYDVGFISRHATTYHREDGIGRFGTSAGTALGSSGPVWTFGVSASGLGKVGARMLAELPNDDL
jgi:hypothetical protein